KFFTSSTSTAGRKVVAVYVVFRIIAVVNLVNQIIFMQEWGDIFILALTLALFTVPLLVERIFNIVIPNLLELIIIVFIFSSTVCSTRLLKVSILVRCLLL